MSNNVTILVPGFLLVGLGRLQSKVGHLRVWLKPICLFLSQVWAFAAQSRMFLLVGPGCGIRFAKLDVFFGDGGKRSH